MTTRAAAVSNLFYPGDPEVLREDVLEYLAQAEAQPIQPKALIVPHAGYIYSGSIAAQAYALLIPLRHTIKRVILLGPCHRVPLNGLAVTGDDYFETPLGDIPLDRKSITEILELPQVIEFDQTHRQEHSLEVQLPFLQEVLDDFTLVPLVVGNATAEEVAEVLDTLWGGEETLIVISSDLSHFYDYETARQLDSQTCKAIEGFDYESLNHESACGRNPIRGLLSEAERRNMTIKTLALKNSGDTAGTKDRVVGYGAWALEES